LNRIAKWTVLALMCAASAGLWAQSEGASSQSTAAKAAAEEASNPVARVRNHQSWEYGPFVDYGVGVGERASYKFLSGGFQIGKAITPVIKAGPLSGQFELSGNIMPLWQAYTPAPHTQTYSCQTSAGVTYSCNLMTGGGTYRGVSITPAIFRWNFLTRSRKIQPWFQAAGGLIYTTHQFPPNMMSNPALGINGSTSVWNFTPQGGLGAHFFVKPRRSIDFGVNAVHISSASLGDRNPGVNALMQFQIGYTYWK